MDSFSAYQSAHSPALVGRAAGCLAFAGGGYSGGMLSVCYAHTAFPPQADSPRRRRAPALVDNCGSAGGVSREILRAGAITTLFTVALLPHRSVTYVMSIAMAVAGRIIPL